MKHFNIKALFGAQDMTQGNPYVNIIKFAIPLLIGNFVQQMYNTVDAIVVGKYVGDAALAAVGAAGPVLNLLFVLFMGVSVGAGIMVSQYYGAKDRAGLSMTVGNALTLTMIATLLIMIIGVSCTHPLLRLLQTPEEDNVFQWTRSYLMIFFSGFVGCAFYNMISGILRGMGDSIMPLVFLVIACVLNILLDILFVAVFDWKVMGVATATILAQFISAILCVFRLLRMRDTVEISRKSLKLRKEISVRIIKLGLPSGLSQMVFSLASIVVQSLINSFGTVVIACCVVVMRVDGFAMMPNFTFGTAMTTYSGQNIGARNVERVRKGNKAGMVLAVSVAVTLTISLFLFGRQLMHLFTDTEELVNLGMHMISIIAIGYIAMGVSQVLQGTMRGAGDTMTPMWLSLITTVAIRVPTAYGLVALTRTAENPAGNPDAIYWSLLISWVIGALLTIIAYRIGGWKKKAQKQMKLNEESKGIEQG